MRAGSRVQVVHYCAKCGKGMQYSEKSMLYFYKVKPIRWADRYPFARPAPQAVMSLNLCEQCRAEAEALVKAWISDQPGHIEPSGG